MFGFASLLSFNLNATESKLQENLLISDECEEFGALLFRASIDRGMDAIDAYDLAMWGRQDCEENW